MVEGLLGSLGDGFDAGIWVWLPQGQGREHASQKGDGSNIEAGRPDQGPSRHGARERVDLYQSWDERLLLSSLHLNPQMLLDWALARHLANIRPGGS